MADEMEMLPLGFVKDDGAVAAGTKWASPSGRHYLDIATDGNVSVCEYATKKIVWESKTHAAGGVGIVRMQADGNFAIYAPGDPAGTPAPGDTRTYRFLWAAGSSVKGSRLTITDLGELQLVGPSPDNKILWSSITGRVPADRAQPSTLFPDSTWLAGGSTAWPYTRDIALGEGKKLTLKGSRAVTNAGFTAVYNVYTTVISRMSTAYPKDKLNGYVVYLVNGEPWSELEKITPVGQMSPAYFGGSYALVPKAVIEGDWFRGGTNTDWLWLDEQMIMKTGVRTRNELKAAGKTLGDDDVRRHHQAVHELGHAIDKRCKLGETIVATFQSSKFGGDPYEAFAWAVQAWFGNPAADSKFSVAERALLAKIFTSSTGLTDDGSPDGTTPASYPAPNLAANTAATAVSPPSAAAKPEGTTLI